VTRLWITKPERQVARGLESLAGPVGPAERSHKSRRDTVRTAATDPNIPLSQPAPAEVAGCCLSHSSCTFRFISASALAYSMGMSLPW
jgi:hypothetical protein